MEDSQLTKRIKSLAWRTAMFAVAAAVAYVSENIGFLELSPAVTAFLGLMLGEVSKYLNTA